MNNQPAPSDRRLAFGPFEYDSLSGELRKYGTRIKLQGQPLQILSILLNRAGALVTREEIQQQLWKGSTFVDFDHGLNAAVNKLRQALSDSADQPRYVETLPGRGYRFVCPIETHQPKPVIEIAPPAAPRPHPSRARMVLPWVAAAMALAALSFYLGSRQTPPTSPQNRVQFAIPPPPGHVFLVASARQGFALSPDGNRLIYTASGTSEILSTWIRNFAELDPRPVPDSAGAFTLFWAPDGDSFFVTTGARLRRFARDGASSQIIGDIPSPTFGGVQLPHGPLLLHSSQSSYTLETGSKPQPLPSTYRWPQFLPGGQVLYVAPGKDTAHWQARVGIYGDPASEKDILLADSRVVYAPSILTPSTGHLLFVRAGSLLAQPFDPHALRLTGEPKTIVQKVASFLPTGGADFSVSSNGTLAYLSLSGRSQLAWVDRQGRPIDGAKPDNVLSKCGKLSPDGHYIATSLYNVDRGAGDIWLFDTRDGAARLLSTQSGHLDAPIWSPDSRRLVYFQGLTTGAKLLLRGIAQNDSEIPITTGPLPFPSAWSPDGRFIAYTNTPSARSVHEANGDVWLIDTARNNQPVPLLNSTHHEANAVFSPDGKWLAFLSGESGRSQAYIQAFEGGDSPRLTGERRLISKDGAGMLRWPTRSKELFYHGADGFLYAVPLNLAPLAIGTPQKLFALDPHARAWLHSYFGFDASADGSRFLIPTVTSPQRSSIVVIQNWERP